jgi:hypothetical protein
MAVSCSKWTAFEEFWLRFIATQFVLPIAPNLGMSVGSHLFATAVAVLFTVCLSTPVFQNFREPGGKRPVILVPGLAGSVLQARLHKDTAPWFCFKNSDWFNIWCVPFYSF